MRDSICNHFLSLSSSYATTYTTLLKHAYCLYDLLGFPFTITYLVLSAVLSLFRVPTSINFVQLSGYDWYCSSSVCCVDAVYQVFFQYSDKSNCLLQLHSGEDIRLLLTHRLSTSWNGVKDRAQETILRYYERNRAFTAFVFILVYLQLISSNHGRPKS